MLDGKEVTSMGADYRNVLGYLQDFGYYPNYTAVEFLMYIAALKRNTEECCKKKRVTELLEVVDLSHVANKKVKTFFWWYETKSRNCTGVT